MKRIFDEEMGVLEYCFGYRLGKTKQNSMSVQIRTLPTPYLNSVYRVGGGGEGQLDTFRYDDIRDEIFSKYTDCTCSQQRTLLRFSRS